MNKITDYDYIRDYEDSTFRNILLATLERLKLYKREQTTLTFSGTGMFTVAGSTTLYIDGESMQATATTSTVTFTCGDGTSTSTNTIEVKK